jgi:hypothetical protein
MRQSRAGSLRVKREAVVLSKYNGTSRESRWKNTMRMFRLVKKDGTILADNLLPSDVFRLIIEGKAKDPFSAKRQGIDEDC